MTHSARRGNRPPVDPDLSAKRRAAGRKGAAARWGRTDTDRAAGQRPKPHTNWSEGLKAWRAERPANATRCRVENRAGDNNQPAEMWIYDEIVDPFLASLGWGVSAGTVRDELAGITADRIELHINSPGGDVFEAHAIYNLLRNHAADIDVTIDGLAASAASYIAMAGDTVTMSGGAMIMIHDAIGLTYGNAADHTDTAARLDKISDGIAALYAERSGGGVDEWRDAMRAETWYDADEAVEAGLADDVVEAGPDDDGAGAENTTDTRPYSEAARHTLPTTDTADTADTGTGDEEYDVASITEALEGAFA